LITFSVARSFAALSAASGSASDVAAGAAIHPSVPWRPKLIPGATRDETSHVSLADSLLKRMNRKSASREMPKVRATLYLSSDVIEEARNAAVHLAGFPARLTLAKLADRALRAELQRLKDQYNNGLDFPPRDADLEGGRPIAA